MTDTQRKVNAKKFAEFWEGKGYEKGQSQSFWTSLLRDVYGVEHPEEYVIFEEQVQLGHTSFIDARIPKTKVLIEQKSINKSLTEKIKQSDGTLKTPFEQAKRYDDSLGYFDKNRWLVICNFQTFHVYDMADSYGEPEVIELKDLEKEYHRLDFLVDIEADNTERELEISQAAGKIVGELYDALLKQYPEPHNERTYQDLNVLCVRLVFCLYAEDADIFGEHLKFNKYLRSFDTQHTRKALQNLFDVLNQPMDERDPFLKDDEPLLAEFPYVNGSLFEKKHVIPPFNDEIRNLLLRDASSGFDWSEISPTIFGAIFESTLNPETRRNGGMHYTMPENIHKVIDPLFLDDLKAELDGIMVEQDLKKRKQKLTNYQNKLASLKFLDPACGSGNFLTETYVSLRKLENKVIAELISLRKKQIENQIVFGGVSEEELIKVSIGQFYGIEINDFAVSVAKTALWIAESQMMRETEKIINQSLDFLPLKTNAFIKEGNALRLDWNDVIKEHDDRNVDFIMGNPPFVGARMMSKEQKDDLLSVFGKEWKNVGNLDYVSGWYKKCADLIKGTNTIAALVSTNSICQGESVANLWKPLYEDGVHIDFAHRTFRWDSEASMKAHVHCVIVGFSYAFSSKPKRIYENGEVQEVKNINGYLIDADNVFVESRSKPICDVPRFGIGNKPIDNGFYLFTEEEKDEFLKVEPKAEKYFKLWYGADEFLNSKPRYCLWLKHCPPSELMSMSECLKRVDSVRQYRLSSKSEGTRKIANFPTKFHVENFPTDSYIVIPEITSEKRLYIPMGFMTPDVLCSNRVKISQNATLYHFGVLTSSVHMAWTRAVCGRLEMRYCYSINVVYNNFPWCSPTDEQKAKIEKTAQAILDARAKYPEASLADMYGEHMYLYPELVKAHQANDAAVAAAYGIPKDMPEAEIVAMLMKMYREMTGRLLTTATL
ncbi:MAG: N-6 DNA methylase [Oscillospiraceae bacterium]|nr:N-6 DNA methylase [Oscillospiraceae bacterium]